MDISKPIVCIPVDIWMLCIFSFACIAAVLNLEAYMYTNACINLFPACMHYLFLLMPGRLVSYYPLLLVRSVYMLPK